MNHEHRNNYDPHAASFHSRNDYWCGVSPANTRPLRNVVNGRVLVAKTELEPSLVLLGETFVQAMAVGIWGLRCIEQFHHILKEITMILNNP